MYTCCECHKPVRAVAGDAIYDLTSRGKICHRCVSNTKAAPPDTRLTEEERSKRSRARWDALTHEQQAARVAKLRAGRAQAKALAQESAL